MRTRRKEQYDQPARESPRPPFDFAQDRLHYASQKRRRRHRNRRYRIMAALLVLGVGTGIVVMLVAYWLTGQL